MVPKDELVFSMSLRSAITCVTLGANPINFLRKLLDDVETLRFADHDIRSVLEPIISNREYMVDCSNELALHIEGGSFTYEDMLRYAKQQIAFFDQHVERFESMFVSIVSKEPHTRLVKRFARGELAFPVEALLINAIKEGWVDSPNDPCYLLARAYLETRPPGFFKDMELQHSSLVAALRGFIGERLLEENRHNLAVKRSYVESEFSL